MPLLVIVAAAALLLALAYRGYGGLLARLLRLDPRAPTPAVRLRDDVDYVPIGPRFLLGQHFSAIAAAGPVVGPVLAGLLFGWLPALLWILIGSVFIGGVHDLTALTASIRHGARSIAEVVREHMNRRAYVLFLLFVWIAMVYVVVAFTDIVAGSFVGRQTLENGVVVSGGGIATASLLYLALPLLMGVLLRTTRLGLARATAIFLPLVGVAIWVGPRIPFEVADWFGIGEADAVHVWDVVLLAYCFVASVVPMWLLLQPRGHLGGYFLYAVLIGSMAGIVLGGHRVEYPAVTGTTAATGESLVPFLFITIACGACSGFHSIVASGTTSKQLRSETDAKPVAYGAMLLEALVALVALSCVMMRSPSSPVLAGAPRPNFIFGSGLGEYLRALGVPAAFATTFALLAFTTFVYDTLDVCTRLGRYILQELAGWRGRAGRLIATALTTGTPLFFVTRTMTDAAGRPVPSWRIFWGLFGASNQLLAALTLIGVTVWLYRTYRARWVWFVTGIPALWMYAMSGLALLEFIQKGFFAKTGEFRAGGADAVSWAALVLAFLALVLLFEAAGAIRSHRRAHRNAASLPAFDRD